MKRKVLVLTLILNILMLVPVFATGHIDGCTSTDFLKNCCTTTFNLVPEAGYKIASLIVNGVTESVTEEQQSGMEYTLSEVTVPQVVEVISEPQSYTITVTQGSNGKLVPVNNTIVDNKITVKHGQTQEFMIVPNSGYMLSTLTVDGVVVKGFVGMSSKKYTFGGIDSDHTIAATFVTQGDVFIKTNSLINGATYIVCSDTKALTHSSSNTVSTSTVTINNDTIQTSNTALIWTATSNGLYYSASSQNYYLNVDSTISITTGGYKVLTYDGSNEWLIGAKGYSSEAYLKYANSSWSGVKGSANASKISIYGKAPSTAPYTITYHANGGTGGMIEQKAVSGYNYLSPNKFTKKDCKFAGWSTTPYGSVSYADGANVRITSNITLFAVWADNLTLTFDANGGTGTMDMLEVSKGVAVTLPANQFTHDTLSFAGWATTPDGDIAYYNSASLTPKKNMILYAVWRPTYYVTFEANGGTGSMAQQAFLSGVPKNLSGLGFSYYGKTFTGWSTSPTGPVQYGNGASLTITQDVTLYAQWTTTRYTLTYDSRGGSGTPAQQTWLHGESVTIATAQPTYSGSTFVGWYTGSGGSGSKVSAGTSYAWTSNVTLYAYWYCNDISYVCYPSNCYDMTECSSCDGSGKCSGDEFLNGPYVDCDCGAMTGSRVCYGCGINMGYHCLNCFTKTLIGEHTCGKCGGSGSGSCIHGDSYGHGICDHYTTTNLSSHNYCTHGYVNAHYY